MEAQDLWPFFSGASSILKRSHKAVVLCNEFIEQEWALHTPSVWHEKDRERSGKKAIFRERP